MIFLIRILIFTVSLYCFWPTVAQANEMVGNHAYGYVGGRILQIAKHNSQNMLHIGSISGKRPIRGVHTKAYVGNDVVIKTAPDTKVVLNIGSVHSK